MISKIILLEVAVLFLVHSSAQAQTSRRGRCEERVALQAELRTLKESQEMLHGEVANLKTALDSLSDFVVSSLPEDCSAAKGRGSWSTTAMIRPPGLTARLARCDQYEDRGGWTVIMARRPVRHRDRVDFNATWQQYKKGFGNIDGEFWIGNEVLHALTREAPHHIRAVLTDMKGAVTSATWHRFTVASEDNLYRLGIGDYQDSSSTADNALRHHNGHDFSTHDTDNDIDPVHCAQRYGGGWWYFQCYMANPTGKALGPNEDGDHGMIWRSDTQKIKLKGITMMIRPARPASYGVRSHPHV